MKPNTIPTLNEKQWKFLESRLDSKPSLEHIKKTKKSISTFDSVKRL